MLTSSVLVDAPKLLTLILHLFYLFFVVENRLLSFSPVCFEREFVNCKSAAMPGSTGSGSYRSLTVNGQNENNVVYRSTTVQGNTTGMLDTVKKAFSFVSSSSPSKGDRLIDVSKTPVILSSRYCIFLLFGFGFSFWSIYVNLMRASKKKKIRLCTIW